MNENRRFEYRLPVEIIVERMVVPGEGAEARKGYLHELSASGCRLEASFPLVVGQEILIQFRLDGGHTLPNVRGRVVRRIPQSKPAMVGVQFLDLSEEDQYKIREYVVWKESRRQG